MLEPPPGEGEETTTMLQEILKSVKSNEEQLLEVNKKLASFEYLKEKILSLEKDNEKLQEKVEYLTRRDDEREQYLRNSSVRVFGLDAPDSEKNNPIKVMNLVYSKLFNPILKLAVDAGEIHEVPGVFELLETAHILPSAKSKSSPIIARFKSRPFRALVFHYKKEYFKTLKDTKTGISEDLTKVKYDLLMKMKKDERVERVWSMNGVIHYCEKKNKDKVLKLKSSYDDLQL